MSTPESMHVQTGKNMGITTGKHFSLASARGLVATALEKISLFAQKAGIKIFAGMGKVEIQAQRDDVDIIADKVMRLISAQEKIVLAAPKEIEFMAGGSYMKLNKEGVEIGTNKKFVAHADTHEFVGPKSATPDNCPLPSGMINDEQFQSLDMEGNPLPGIPYRIEGGSGQILAEGFTDLNGRTPRVYSIKREAVRIIWGLKKS